MLHGGDEDLVVSPLFSHRRGDRGYVGYGAKMYSAVLMYNLFKNSEINTPHFK